MSMIDRSNVMSSSDLRAMSNTNLCNTPSEMIISNVNPFTNKVLNSPKGN
jgi:hypothetical protein